MEYMRGEDMLDDELDENYKLQEQIMDLMPWSIQNYAEWAIDLMNDLQKDAEKNLDDRRLNLLKMVAEWEEGDNGRMNWIKEHIEATKIKGGFGKYTGLEIQDLTLNSNFCFVEDAEQTELNTEEWNPMTFAIYYNDLELMNYILNNFPEYTKKTTKVRGTNLSAAYVSLFKLLYSFESEWDDIFDYWLYNHEYLWTDDVNMVLFL